MNFGKLNFANFPIQFATPLGPAAWAVLAGIPVGIIALYFLKLRRRPVQVPSTLLWRRSLEDLHVNSLFQRLRRNLLLFLQLLAVLLAMLALAGPKGKGSTGYGQRYVLAIDNSASMASSDVPPTRLAKAKEEAKKIIQSMESDDLAMVISFSDRAKVVSNYTGDTRQLLRRIDAIPQTESTTSLREALQVAAGLANPSKQIGEGVVASSVVPPKLFIYTDGGFADVEGFSLGNLEPEVVVIGPPPDPIASSEDPKASREKVKDPSDNVAILALQTARNEDRPDTYQVFGRVHNFRRDPVETEAKLLRHDPAKPSAEPTLIDAIQLKIPAQSEQSFKFDLPDTGLSELEVRLDADDALTLDNRAFTLIGNPRKAQVLVVTDGNRYLVDTLKTPTAQEHADVTVVTPEEYKNDPLSRDVKAGRFDLVIFDRFRPEIAPEANALYFGVLPPGKAYEKSKDLEPPLVILDTNISHPLMQFIRDMPTVRIIKAVGVEPPPGSSILIESNQGPLAFVAPREGYADAVVTFAMLKDKNELNTDWYKLISFPLFIYNSIQVLGNARDSVGDEVHLPGQPITLRADTFKDRVTVDLPAGKRTQDGKSSETLSRTPQGSFIANATDVTGIYHARWDPKGTMPFVVNQFDFRESNLAPRGLVPPGVPESQADNYKIKIGYNPVAGTQRVRPSRKDWWKAITVAVLGVLMLEWYIYNKRVYV
jgi:hypothetical protein